MIIISAMSRDRVIGSGDGMPWSVPEEYAHFLATVRGATVIMGRRSFEIFGNDLAESHVIVVSRSRHDLPGAVVVPGIEEAVREAERSGGEVFSAGGASIYRQTVPLADAMYLSYIEGAYEGDAHFPAFDEAEWTVERREDRPGFEFVVYRRRS